MKDAEQAIVLRRDDGRFYRGMSSAGRLQTTRILAEAKLFVPAPGSGILEAYIDLCKRGSQAERVIVRMESE